MNTSKINFWVIAIIMIFAGSLLIYLEDYRNSQLLVAIIYLLMFFGWITFFIQLTKGTIIDAKKIPFKEDRIKSLQQGVAKFFAYIVLIAIVFGNIFYVSHLARGRKKDLLLNAPTQTAIAEINDIEVTHGRSGTYYHAIFLFKTTAGKPVRYSWSEDRGDFTEGQRYEIKYVVEYPEMFKIIRMLP
jgi:hypothetical protein